MQLQDEYLEKTMSMIDTRIVLLDDLFSDHLYEYLWKEPELKREHVDSSEQFRFVITETLENLPQITFTHDDVKKLIQKYQPKKISPKQVFRIWRLVLCGCLQGPPVHEISTFFGSEIVRSRLQRALRALEQQNEEVPVKL